MAGIRRNQYIACATLACTTTILLVAVEPANAQETRHSATNKPDFVRNFGEFVRSIDDADFDARWHADGNEYVLGDDGIIRSSAGITEPDAIDHQVTQYGSDISNAHNLDMDNYLSIMGILYDPDESQNGLIDHAPDGSNSIAECGPSPLSVEKIEQLVVKAARHHGVDEDFATAIAWAESGFDRHRNSDAGARGPMQLMPATAERFSAADVCDPHENIDAGVRYLRHLLEEFANPIIAAAAYNAGEARIHEYGGVPPFHETVNYVAKVLNYQLGLPMPSTAGSDVTPVADSTSSDAPLAGVIQEKTPGAFVGGVMHF